MSKCLWVVSGGIEALPGIKRARERGLHVVVSDGDLDAPAFKLADDRIIASTYDVKDSVAKAVAYHNDVRPIDGVISIAADVPLTVASIADALDLPGIPLDAANLAMNKLAMKQKFLADGVPVPWFAPIGSAMELVRIAAEEGYPLILKPVDSRGARGVLHLTPEVELQWAYELSLEHSPSGQLIVERYLEGPQLSTESLIIDGTAHTIGLSDRNYDRMAQFAPFVVEDGGDLPSRLPDHILAEAHGVVEDAARSLGVTDGVVKGDIVIHREKASVIEIAPRLSGGHFCTVEIPFSTGVDFVGNAIRIALGETVAPEDIVPRHQKHLCQRYLFPKPGLVTRISGADKVASRPEMVFCEIRVVPGDTIGPIENHPGRAGVVMTTGNSRDEAIFNAEAAVRDILIYTENN